METPLNGNVSVEKGAGAGTTMGSGPHIFPTMLTMIIATARVVMIQAWPWLLCRNTGATANRSSKTANAATAIMATTKATHHGNFI